MPFYPMMYGFGMFDPMYLLFVVVPLILSMWASTRVNSTFKKFSKYGNGRNMTAAQVTRMILDRNGQRDVAIERVSGNLTDHYDPRNNTIRLSESVYDSTSVSAIGVAAHEAGHAAQYASGYFPIKVRNTIAPVANFASQLAVPLILIGFLFSWFGLINIAIILYAVVVVFSLVTLPVEFNASRRAIQTLDSYGVLTMEENEAAKKVLKAAAMTYIVSTLASVGSLLFLLFRTGGGNRE